MMHTLLISLVLSSTFLVVSSIYCDYGPWSSWSDCSVTCGEGIKKRSKTCEKQDYCNCRYPTTVEQTMKCFVPATEWGQWKDKGCDKKCKKRRWLRKCKWIKGCEGRGKPTCDGKKKEKKSEKCNPDCEWSSWTMEYGCQLVGKYEKKCIKAFKRDCTCDPRHCKCKGNDKKTEMCDPSNCCECEWGEWYLKRDCYLAGYNKCIKEYTRDCDCKPPYCPEDCTGPNTRTAMCDIKDCCKCTWSAWENDGECMLDSKGNCVQKQKRRCECNHDYCPKDCPGDSERYIPCKNPNDCCECEWSDWYLKKDCYLVGYNKCIKEYTRDCDCKPPYCPEDCTGPNTRTAMCDIKDCCKCKWSAWENVGECMLNSKGKCVQKQKRRCECNHDYCPKDCPGDSEQYIECEDPNGCCECEWSSWYIKKDCYLAGYNKCIKQYTRDCECTPDYCPEDCDGSDTRTATCDLKDCCDCGWGPWYDDGPCYKPDYQPECLQDQKRECNCPRDCPKCEGSNKRTVDCAVTYC